MNPQKINGHYCVSLDFTKMTQNFGFNGNSRGVDVHASDAFVPTAYCTNNYGAMTVKSMFFATNDLIIKKIRLRTVLAEWLRIGDSYNGLIGANLCVFQKFEDGTYGSQFLNLMFTKFNEWEEVNYIYKPYALLNPGDENRKYEFICDNTESAICVDDYNIQAAYLNQKFYPIVDMIVDTAGVFNTSTQEIF